MTKQEKAQAQLDAHFLSHSTVTTLELKQDLIKNWPDEYWSQQWVSGFMQNQELDWTDSDNGRYRIYQAPISLNLTHLEDYCQDIIDLDENITKSNLKSLIRADGLPLGKFKELFDQLGLQHTGKYTSDNHKIWVKVPVGKHLSKNKKQLVDIKDMPKPYLKNAIAKYVAEYGIPDMHYILSKPDSELYKLLAAFFTHEIRNSI